MQHKAIAFPRRATFAIALVVLCVALSPVRAAERRSSGSGVVMGSQGEILTNAHVVRECTRVTVRPPSGDPFAAHVIASDDKNDLALVSGSPSLSARAVFRDGAAVRAGEPAVAMGYPLSGLLAATANLSSGIVSALAGLRNDQRYLQISAPVQPGNSGGPLLDSSGHLIGIVSSKLNAALVAQYTGDIPQNVNFALKAEAARTFLDSKTIAYRTARSDQNLSAADVGDIARPFTVQLECVSLNSAEQRAPAAAVSQQAVLYEEDPNNPRGRSSYGLATWRTVRLSSGKAKDQSSEPGGQGEPAIVAQITIPGHLVALLTLRRNTDQNLAASHVITITFNMPPNSPGGGVSTVPGVLMKASEGVAGVALAGLSEKVRNSSFIIGLSAASPAMQRNLQLLRDRDWLDVTIVYNNGKRAILALQKGPSGNRAFAEAFSAWRE
jgi:S1-C subfamily serine protease